MNKTGKLVMHIKVQPWLKWAAIPFVLLGLEIPNFIVSAACKVTGPYHE